MRKLLICSILPLLVVATACGNDAASSPSAVASNTLATTGGSTPATRTEPGATAPNATTDGGTDDTQGTDDTSGTDDTNGDGTSGTDGSGGTSGSGTNGPPGTSTGTPGTGGQAPSTNGPPGTDTIDWQTIKGEKGVQQGTLDVPIDYQDPSKGHFTLALVRHLAEKPKQRIGSLLVNPGGPGLSGTALAEQADGIYGQDLLDRFDIVAWDPRGTGATTPAIDCITDYDHFYDNSDITPDTPAEKEQIIDLQQEFTDDCVSKNADILDFVGTNDSARDMNTIRVALREAKISYFGFSYGSELGATWATLFPDTVRAAVLDGAVDPNAGFVQSGLDQIKGFEASLDTFLQQCSAQTSCAFHNGGHADTAFDQLMQSMDEHPLPTEEGRPALTRGAALNGVAEAMYSNASWPQLADALTEAQHGDGSGLMELYDEYFQRHPDGSYDNFLEAFAVIMCMSDATRLTVAQDDANAAEYTAVAPRLSPGTTGSYQCTFFPPSPDPRVKITGVGAGPILVVGTTGDPATPLAGTRNMARALQGGVLLVVDGEQHTGYDVNACSKDTVDAYLVDPVQDVPKDGTECK